MRYINYNKNTVHAQYFTIHLVCMFYDRCNFQNRQIVVELHSLQTHDILKF